MAKGSVVISAPPTNTWSEPSVNTKVVPIGVRVPGASVYYEYIRNDSHTGIGNPFSGRRRFETICACISVIYDEQIFKP